MNKPETDTMNNCSDSPLRPGQERLYQEWRAWKLSRLPGPDRERILPAIDAANPDHETLGTMLASISASNMALFRVTDPEHFRPDDLKKIGEAFGLHRLDSNLYADDNAISEVRVVETGRRGEYIPYTNQPLGWHTDGYYNSPERTIRAFTLYCHSDAPSGGVNEMVDPEILYIRLRDLNPAWVEALMQPDVLTIPETVENDQLVRPEQQSPVFNIDAETGSLHMRYTRRKTHIHWKQEPLVIEALDTIRRLLDEKSVPMLKVRLEPGQGLICNNVLHNRSAFVDDRQHPRILYRARYHDRIANTDSTRKFLHADIE